MWYQTMFRSLLILLIINTYGRGLGIPLNQSSPNGIIASSLEELAKSCANKFLVQEITNHLKECNVAFGKPFTETQFQCSLLYDITSQLCAAVASHKLELIQDDYTSQVNVDLNVSDLCNISKHWNVADLPNYPSYKESVSKLFSNDVTCGRLCGGPDLFDVNYYCKFYKWGTDVLKSSVVSIQPSSVDKKADPVPSGEDTKTQISDISNSFKINNTQQIEVEKSIPNEPTKTNKIPTNVNELTGKMSEVISAAGEQELLSSEQVVAQQQTANNKDHKDVENNDLKFSVKDKQSNVSNLVPIIEETGQGPTPSAKAIKKEEVEGGKLADNKAMVSDVIDNPKSNLGGNADPDDYQDSDDIKEGLLDLQNGEDGVDPAINDANDTPYLQSTKASTKILRPISSYNGDSQRNIYRDMPEAFLDEEEGNFFPVFLTTVIIVAMLYILYHNRSKVLGLIVEGRQPGRRRTSRGHAYRRLDTLEQAMSSSTAAAPSKIIY